MQKFAANDRIRVSPTFFCGPWKDGLTRQEKSALGEATVYWIWFDEPQFDADGDGPYRGGQIHADAMTLISN